MLRLLDQADSQTRADFRSPTLRRPTHDHQVELKVNARSILVVEDSSEHRELIAALLEPAGIEVSFAHNAEQAFAQLKTARPHLILMDILLPGMSGLDLTSELRRTSVLDDVGIVALTALAMSGDEETARSD